ncbi:MAG: hypothetical protein E6J55_00570, partial [Deltaproteobacteria bacterium]
RADRAWRLGRLTPRERQVLDLVVDGKTNREIAGTLAMREKTVEYHRASLMRKLSVDSLAENDPSRHHARTRHTVATLVLPSVVGHPVGPRDHSLLHGGVARRSGARPARAGEGAPVFHRLGLTARARRGRASGAPAPWGWGSPESIRGISEFTDTFGTDYR